ncbi:MAG TPA: CopG family antitoxin [Nitrospinota bacterium]|nr:CopG family antitoxin [Nitrospinota bacterium]
MEEFRAMKKKHDFSDLIENPSEKQLKKQVTLRLNVDVIDYFTKLAGETGVPYDSLINLYLQDCARSKKKLKFKWAS